MIKFIENIIDYKVALETIDRDKRMGRNETLKMMNDKTVRKIRKIGYEVEHVEAQLYLIKWSHNEYL